jgi:hypothetical protein
MHKQDKHPIDNENTFQANQDKIMIEDLENEKFICRLEIQRKLLKNFIDVANSQPITKKGENNIG